MTDKQEVDYSTMELDEIIAERERLNTITEKYAEQGARMIENPDDYDDSYRRKFSIDVLAHARIHLGAIKATRDRIDRLSEEKETEAVV